MESKQIQKVVEAGETSEEHKNPAVCSFCETIETPLWRTGPLGPKTLCNACGIKYSKKRPPSPVAGSSGASTSGGGDKDKKLKNLASMEGEEDVEGEEWGEVERAALLLMALSCGVIFT